MGFAVAADFALDPVGGVEAAVAGGLAPRWRRLAALWVVCSGMRGGGIVAAALELGVVASLVWSEDKPQYEVEYGSMGV
jgi:hypothetical protein